MPEGRESPPPERQSGKQMHDTLGSGKTSGKTEKVDPKTQLDKLESNPKDIMEDTLKQKYGDLHKY